MFWINDEDYENEIKGISFILGRNIFHLGRYSYGYWFDRCTQNHPIEKKGWGIKIDIAFGNTIRPIPMFWKKGFWTRKPTIKEVMYRGEEEFKEYFGEKLANEILQIRESDWVKSAHNPWLAKYWFVIRIISKWIPWPSFSIGTPLLSFHIGSKGISPTPLDNDRTWCEKSEEELAVKYDPKERFHALALSWTVRNHRY